MCGIVGYVGGRPCEELLLSGLEKLEYRGYDSAGLSMLEGGEVESVHAVGNLANLRAAVEERAANGAGALAPANTGIAHTRWATHGRVTEENAHPHDDSSGRVHIVLNGIVENHAGLRKRLQGAGETFTSDTDAEVVAHLIAAHYDGDLAAAVRAAYAELRGHYAFVAMHADEPQRLVGARKECPLVAGIGEGETFLASAIPAFLADTRTAVPIENGEIVEIEAGEVRITDTDGTPIERGSEEVTWDADAVLYTRAGLEIGVAATKTFLAQVAAMYVLGLRIAELRGSLPPARIAELVAEMKALPSKIDETLELTEEPVRAVATAHSEQNFFLYLGRHIGLPVCLEGALKLKEISYIPTDAYAAGEMKHGPIALLDESTPVVCIATDSPVLEKVLSNVEEVRARGAQTIAVATAGSERAGEVADETIAVARTDWILQPIVAILPLQLLAYDIARARGLNVDQPRNLAKTVTVE
jgi:glucosamine 6-phosphate synthetase-like amidotransferase/phosphosugar isomerase protein